MQFLERDYNNLVKSNNTMRQNNMQNSIGSNLSNFESKGQMPNWYVNLKQKEKR